MPELGTSGSVGTAGEQSPAVTRPSGLALLGIVYALILRLFTNIWVTGWTLLFIAMLFLGGVQLLFLGIMGEYLGRIYGEVKRRPLYLVKERFGFSAESRATTRAGTASA